MSEPDVLIIGAGISGAIIASELAEAGQSVVMLDAGEYFPSSDRERFQDLLDRFYESADRVPNSPFPRNPLAPMAYENRPGDYYYGSAQGSPGAPPPARRKPDGGKWGLFESTAAKIVGGTTMHWLGTCL